MPQEQEPKTVSRTRVLLRTTKEVVVTLVMCVVCCGIVISIILYATREHWILGMIATAFFAYAAYLGISDLRSHEARGFPIHKGLAIFLLTVFIVIAVAASLSLQLLRVGWAVYEPVSPENDPYGTLISYYVWVFLDMLPGIKASELLAFTAPLRPMNSVAGIPVIAFRAFVLFGLLAALKVWWQGRMPAATGPRAQIRTNSALSVDNRTSDGN
jgi:hypothetical protein